MIITPLFSLMLMLIFIGVVGFLIVKYMPMVEPIKTVVVIGFVIIAIYFLFRIVGTMGGVVF